MQKFVAIFVFAVLCVSVESQSDIDFCNQLPIILGIGSSTVFPLVELYARQYSADLVAPIVRSSGSGLGIQDFLVGSTDLGHASRAMKESDYTGVRTEKSAYAVDIIAVESRGGQWLCVEVVLRAAFNRLTAVFQLQCLSSELTLRLPAKEFSQCLLWLPRI